MAIPHPKQHSPKPEPVPEDEAGSFFEGALFTFLGGICALVAGVVLFGGGVFNSISSDISRDPASQDQTIDRPTDASTSIPDYYTELPNGY